ncbi:hypothetical protein PBRA_008395, partial [Plasmodiophora brassicae]
TGRVKWTTVKAAGAAAGVAGLGSASWWVNNRYLKGKPGHERAVVNKAGELVASHLSNLKSHVTKVNAVTAAKKGVSILGFDWVDMLFMAVAGLFALDEFHPAPTRPADRNDMDKDTLEKAGVPYIPDSEIMPANTTGEKLNGLRMKFGPNAVFYVIQSVTLNPMGIADRMHMIDAVLRHVRSDDLVNTDGGGRTALWSIIDLALDDVMAFDQRLPVIRALLTHDAVTADMVNHRDRRGATMLHSIVNEIRFPSTRPGRVGFLVNIANMLLDKGADGTIADNGKYGFTPRSMVIDAIR